MQLTKAAIQNGYRMHHSVYHDQRLWNVPYHIECWEMAAAAFEQGHDDKFVGLYRELKNRWQALRPKAFSAWAADKMFEHLRQQDQRWRARALHDFEDSDVAECYRIVTSMSGIKPMKYGPSVVAISKFLHFWNPSLFVIVDDAVMWRWVLAHKWIWQGIADTRTRIQPLLGIDESVGTTCDVSSYVAIVRWSAGLVRANPQIAECFGRYVLAHGKTDLPIARYEAAAVEWLLLGLVEAPPGGVKLGDGLH